MLARVIIDGIHAACLWFIIVSKTYSLRPDYLNFILFLVAFCITGQTIHGGIRYYRIAQYTGTRKWLFDEIDGKHDNERD